MLKIENVVLPSAEQWVAIIRGMRNPKNSWDRSDSEWMFESTNDMSGGYINMGPNDLKLMNQLASGGPVHAKYRRMIPVYLDITAPLYWWKEFDTYKIGTVANSCSTMHKIHEKEFTLADFSHERLRPRALQKLESTIEELNYWRDIYNNGGMDDNYDGTARVYEPNDKDAWHQMIQLLPSSYNQKRTVMLNYEVLVGIYKWRRNHKLDCWHTLCDFIETLPYAELITGERENVD